MNDLEKIYYPHQTVKMMEARLNTLGLIFRKRPFDNSRYVTVNIYLGLFYN